MTSDQSNSRLPRASMIVACLALFVVIGGSAYAAKDLITGKQIAKNTVTSKNVKNATLKKKDLNKKTISALTGAKGPKGDTGPAGADGVVTPQYIAEDTLENIAANTEEVVLTKNVPSGSYVVTATVDMFSQGAGIGGCNLLANGASVDDVGFNETAGSVNTRASLALQGVTPAGTTQLRISCGAGASAISASSVSIIGIPVG